MRTKHLLTAIALPMLFAACTAEELGTVDNTVKEDLSKRPVVEGVKIAFGDAETRASQGANFNTIKFEAGDKVGALLVDQVANATASDPIKRYNLLQTNFNTNYVFGTEDGTSFASEAYLTEGNYVFYYPFNGQRTRNQILTDLPTEQVLTKGADGVYTSFPSVLSYSEEKGAPLAIGYDFISSADADKTVKSELKQIYAVPLITIRNGYTEKDANNKDVPTAVKIQQIVLSKDDGFTVKAPLKFASAASQTAYAEAVNGTAGAQFSLNKSIVSALFNEAAPEDPANVKKGFWFGGISVEKATSDIIGSAVTNGTAEEIVLRLEAPVEVAAEGSFSFYAVIPAEDYETNNLKVKVINDKGLESATAIELGGVKLQPSKRYPNSEYNTDGSLSDAKGEALTGDMVDFDNTGVMVSTADELIAAVRDAKAGELSLRLSGNATINSRVASYLATTSTKATSIKIVNAAKAEGTFTLNPKKVVTFQKGLTIAAKANVTFNENTNIVIAENNTLNIAAEATLTHKAATLTGVTVNNAGTLKLARNISAKAINNSGVVSVEDNATVTTDDGVFSNGNNNKVEAVLNIAKGKTLTLATGKLINKEKATINNEGTLATEGLLTNNDKATINNGSAENFDAVISDLSTAASTNSGKINNYGSVTIKTNSGTIDMKNVNAKANITDGTGTVNNDVLAVVSASGNKITYTMTGAQKEIPVAIRNAVNTIILNNVTMTLEDNKIGYGYDIEIVGATTFNSNGGAGTVWKFGLADNKKITLTNGATMTVNAGVSVGRATSALEIKFGTGAKIVNYGTVYAAEPEEGKFSGTGSWTESGMPE